MAMPFNSVFLFEPSLKVVSMIHPDFTLLFDESNLEPEMENCRNLSSDGNNINIDVSFSAPIPVPSVFDILATYQNSNDIFNYFYHEEVKYQEEQIADCWTKFLASSAGSTAYGWANTVANAGSASYSASANTLYPTANAVQEAAANAVAASNHQNSAVLFQLTNSTLNQRDDTNNFAAFDSAFWITNEDDIERAANFYRSSAAANNASYHWSGCLPVRVYKSASFSCKVFLGGVPWDITEVDLVAAFNCFGNLHVLWHTKDCVSTIQQHRSAPKGYCYLIFDQEFSVRDLLKNCISQNDYYCKISSSKMKDKAVQVIPWCINDNQYSTTNSEVENLSNVQSGPRLNSKRTVFIGSLHGMITAESLASIMENLFGPVCNASLDTDKYKYPIGSGRVTFVTDESYSRAVQANFVEVKTHKFTKTIQIDPYLEDSTCQHCIYGPGIYFCRSLDCFRYFCPQCWQLWHSVSDAVYNHKPLRRIFKTGSTPSK